MALLSYSSDYTTHLRLVVSKLCTCVAFVLLVAHVLPICVEVKNVVELWLRQACRKFTCVFFCVAGCLFGLSFFIKQTLGFGF